MLIKLMRALELIAGSILSSVGVGTQIATVTTCVFLLLIGRLTLEGWLA